MKLTAITLSGYLMVTALLTSFSLTTNAQSAINSVEPVTTFNNLKVEASNKKVNIDWLSKDGGTSSFYEVERTFNACDYKTVGLVLDGFETADAKKTYKFRDNSNELTGHNIAYYRLKLVNNDGTFSYSSLLEVRL